MRHFSPCKHLSVAKDYSHKLGISVDPFLSPTGSRWMRTIEDVARSYLPLLIKSRVACL
ncbi:hypothetical protein PISMIDRAFT_365500 [Pisolithus microcarpus 441]|uniref:Uncharacterized protein n=1 Tax=Pisolithus microcarpus 441 TaxID=765257 RepID=A0A0C9YIJ6_9AGAM|nr:hypothetical protein PISMIDRAFT_365500 [Pisolithus microcarpus 441]